MAATTKLIAQAAFAPYQDVSAYIAASYIDKYILSAQRKAIRPILGDATYDALQAAVAASTTDANDDALLAVITPVLTYRAMIEYLGFSKVFFKNMGPRVLSDDQSREATNTEIQTIAARCKTEADIYTRELWVFLETNKGTYTTWRDDTQRWQKPMINFSGLGVVRKRDTSDRRARLHDRDF